MMKEPICSRCKSNHVKVDAWAEWDGAKQDWELSQTFEKPAHCEDCGDETTLEWRGMTREYSK